MRRACSPVTAIVVVAVLYGLTPLARVVLGTPYLRASVIVSEDHSLVVPVDSKATSDDTLAAAAQPDPSGVFFECLVTPGHPASAAAHVTPSRSPRPPPVPARF